MSEPITFTVRYTKGQCLATAGRYCQKRLGYRYGLEFVIGAGLVILATQGPWRWLEMALMGLMGIFALVGVGVFIIHWQRALLGLRILDPPESVWILTEKAVAQRSNLGESALGWEALHEVWRFDNLWLLFWGKGVYSMIPVAQFPREARDLVERRVRETGGNVR